MKALKYFRNIAGVPLLFEWQTVPVFQLQSIRINPDYAAAGQTGPLPPPARLHLALLTSLLYGELTVMPLDGFALEHLTPFRRQVLLTLHDRVPRGHTVSYAQLAMMAGSPRAVRAVGSAMHVNPFPIAIPCHRVIAADGSLGGFGPGLLWKRWLLSLEKNA